MLVWTNGFHNPLAHTDFNMFVDEWTSADESPGSKEIFDAHPLHLDLLFFILMQLSGKPGRTIGWQPLRISGSGTEYISQSSQAMMDCDSLLQGTVVKFVR